MKKISRALLSVSDKTGIVEFAEGLAKLGVEIVSTGGTAKLLREKGVKVRDVADLTGFPEMLDGRVKTLHPKVHGGILVIRSNPEHAAAVQEHQIDFIDLVAVNLYPFEKTAAKPGVKLEELIENIDIGGPSMIRSAAKNFEDVAVVVDPADYPVVLEEVGKNGGTERETRARLARKAFAKTAAYDGFISATLQARAKEGLPENLHLNFQKIADLRYGENPHQSAALYRSSEQAGLGLAAARQVQGKELSYNNLVDLEAAWRLAQEFTDEMVTAIIKHTNPCGIATGKTLAESYDRALAGDPVSAFGSVIAFNRQVDLPTAEKIAGMFVEAVIAPGFEPKALERLASRKNLRVMDMSAAAGDDAGLQLRCIGGGLLVQTPDTLAESPADWKCVTKRQPSAEEQSTLAFAWRVAKHVKSNAIVYARDNMIVGVGAGQMSRVDAVKLGAMKALDLKHSLEGSVIASDAFFPFPDGVEAAARAGATAVIQPGGSVRDSEVIEAADRLELAMLFTGTRHFRH